FVDVVLDQAEQKGTGRWTVQTALDLGVPVGGIAEAVFARSVSGHAALRDAARTLPGQSRADGVGSRFADAVAPAPQPPKIIEYAQGFHESKAGSAEYGWNSDLGAMATIWRGGCIIRARFLDRIRAAYEADPETPTLLTDDHFAEAAGEAQDAWREVVATAARLGIPAPGFSTALAYYDSLRAPRLPAALTQGQPDSFGAPTDRRVDRDGSSPTLWGADRSEVTA